ncbi:Protein SlyX [BD1-7 clade bacterium]|uniref:Protein SlyX n=1 Tax=BD1-7 clade bacterium TaxID=2029982 RepID=A0A5S9R198_9GAMM|nr:Protein SlyX [BD1-7 clade bacterium]CAA0106207.1 Protein SlyX [BD1-7 clade bacterium]CAA0125871.1 Protein SlyX [BD1-7 clade bacterium]
MTLPEDAHEQLVDQLTEQLIHLQTQATYQEDTIQTLNDMVAKQQQDIMDIQKKMDNLVEELKLVLQSADSSSINTGFEKPPHY